MEGMKPGILVKSLAGHDKGGIFLIIKEEKEYVYISDGKSRPVEAAKRKKTKHVERISFECKEILQRIKSGYPLRNEDIKYAIKAYRRETLNVKG